MPIKLGITHSDLAFMSVLHTGLQGKILPLLHHPSSARQHNKRGTHSMYFVQTAVQYYQNHFFLTTSQICPLEHLNFLPPRILTLKQPPPPEKKATLFLLKKSSSHFPEQTNCPHSGFPKPKYNLAAVRLEKFQSEGQELGKTESYKTEVQNGNFCASQSCRNHWLPAAANSS